MIGIKIANGEFYPIMGERGASAKRLVLTTVKDDQKTVHIDLYRGEQDSFRDAAYLGSLVIDGIAARPKQVPDIELVMGVDDSGGLRARATDRESGASQSLSVSLDSGVKEPDALSLPDFELEQSDLELGAAPTLEMPIEDEFDARITSSSYKASSDYAAQVPPQLTQIREAGAKPSPRQELAEQKPRMSPIAVAAIILAILAALLLLAFIVYKLIGPGLAGKSAATASPQATVASPEPTAEPTASPSPSPTLEPTPVPTASPVKAAAGELGKNGSKGLWHKIKWGDTLWDIATRYYGNPWQYKKIAKANKIKNPDLIISGNKLWIPPR